MCVCNDGYVMMDDECVPESQCGCNTEDGATIPLGSTIESCDEICTCGNDKMYSCAPLPAGPAKAGCVTTADANVNALADLDGLYDEFSLKANLNFAGSFLDNTDKKLKKVVQRIKKYKNKFVCAGAERKRREEGDRSALEGDCPRLSELLDDVSKWVTDNITDCKDQNKRGVRFSKKVDNIKKTVEKRCDKKLAP